LFFAEKLICLPLPEMRGSGSIEFLEQQPVIAGVGYHRLLFLKIEVMSMFTDNNALDRSVLLKIHINIHSISFNC
jgi:hypothetical protein